MKLTTIILELSKDQVQDFVTNKVSQALSKYEDASDKGSTVRNKNTDVTRGDFERNLKNSGYQEVPTRDPDVRAYIKDGQKYTTRTKSNAGPPTAEFFPKGIRKAKLKIRLKP